MPPGATSYMLPIKGCYQEHREAASFIFEGVRVCGLGRRMMGEVIYPLVPPKEGLWDLHPHGGPWGQTLLELHTWFCLP